MYLYYSHIGRYYASDELVNIKLCESCSDKDIYLGVYWTEEERQKMIANHKKSK